MKVLLITLLVLFLLACLHKANELSGSSPKRFIIGLILMLCGGVSLFIFSWFGSLTFLEYLSLCFIVAGDLLWIVSERRTINNGRRA
jgi:hypothetical protein